MARSMLEHIKGAIGIEPENIGFDDELLLFINSSAATLVQLGINEMDLVIDSKTFFPTFSNDQLGALVKHYLIIKTKIDFDPTASETIARSIERTATQLEGRIAYEMENILNP